MSLLLRKKNRKWCPDSPDTKKAYSAPGAAKVITVDVVPAALRPRYGWENALPRPYTAPLVRAIVADTPFQYYTQEYTNLGGVRAVATNNPVNQPALVVSLWSKIAHLDTMTWPRNEHLMIFFGNVTGSEIWSYALYTVASVFSPGVIKVDYHLLLSDENLFAGPILDLVLYSATVPEATASDWHWTALQVSVGPTQFDVNLWLKSGPDETLVGPISTSFVYTTYSPTWVPTQISRLFFGWAGEDPGATDSYYYHGNAQATAGIPTDSTLEAIADSVPPYPGSWADWNLSWINGSPDFSDLSGNGQTIGPISLPVLGGPPFIVPAKKMRAWGFIPETPTPYRRPWVKADYVDVETAIVVVSAKGGFDSALPVWPKAVRSQAANLEVEPALDTPRGGFEAVMPKPFQAPKWQAGLVEVQPTPISGRGGYEAVMPRLFRAPWLQAGLVEVQPVTISGRGGYEAELPRPFRAPWLQAGLVETEPKLLAVHDGFEAELPRPYRASWLQAGAVDVMPSVAVVVYDGFEAELPRGYRAPWPQAGLVDVEPYIISGRDGFDAEIPRPFRAPRPQASLVEVEPSINAGFFGWENQLALPRRFQSAVVHFEEWPEALVVEGEWGFEAVLPKPYRAPWPQAGLVEVQPFIISGRGGYEAEMPRPFRAPLPQAGLVEVRPAVLSGRGGFEAVLPRPYRAPLPQAGLVEVEPSITISSFGWDNQLALPRRFQSAVVHFEEWPEELVVEGEWGFEAVLPKPYRAPWPQAGLVEVQPFIISGRGGYEAEMPRPFRAPLPQAGLVEVRPAVLSGRGGFEAVLPRPYRAPLPQAGLVEVEPSITISSFGWDNQLALPRRFQSAVVHFEEWPEALVVEGEWGFEAVLPKPYRAPWPQAGLVEVQPFLISGRGGYEAEMPRPFRAPWPQAGLVEVRPAVISGRGGYEAEMPRLFRAPWLQAGLVEVEPAIKVSGSYGWEVDLQPRHFKAQISPTELPYFQSAVQYGFDAELPRAYRAPALQAKIDDWVPLLVCPTVSALPAHGSITTSGGTTTILPFFTPAPSFILLGIATQRTGGGPPPINIVFVGGDASGLTWKKLAGGQVGATDYTVEYWGAFAPFAISADSVDVITNDRGETSVAFIALAGVNSTPLGSVIGPTTVANNLYVAFPSTSPRSMLFAAGVSVPDDTEALTPGLNTTLYEQPGPAQFVRSTDPTLGGMLTMSTSGYTGATSVYYLGVEILSLPCNLSGLYGWDPVVASKAPAAYRPLDDLNVETTVVTTVVFAGFEAELPRQRKVPQPAAIIVDVEPVVVTVGGFEEVSIARRKITLGSSLFDVFPQQIVVTATMGFDFVAPAIWKAAVQAGPTETWPVPLSGLYGWEQSLPSLWRFMPAQAGPIDVLPAVFISTYGWEQSLPLPYRAALTRPAQFETWAETQIAEGDWGFEEELPRIWRPVPTQAGLVDVLPAVFTSGYGWEQSLPTPYRTAFLSPAQAEAWPEAIIVEGDYGFEQALPPQWKRLPSQAGLVEIWPVALSGRYGWEQSLPAPHRLGLSPASMFEPWPETIIVEGTWGFDEALPALWRLAPLQASLVDVLPTVFTSVFGWEQTLPVPYRASFLPPAPAEVWPESIIVEGAWGFEQALPPSWRPVSTQASLVEVWPSIIVGTYGWEQSLPTPFRAAFLSTGMFDTWPAAEIEEGTWGFDETLPPLWRAAPLQASLVEVFPTVFTNVAGWEQSLPAPFRAAFLPPAQAEVWPEAYIVEGTWGFEQALPSLWKPVPTQAGLVDVWPALVVGTYGWEQSLPAPFRAAFLPVSMFETWPPAEVEEGTWGFDEALPPLWRAAPLQAGLVEVFPTVFTSVAGWEQSLPAPFRAAFLPPAQAEIWPEAYIAFGTWGFEQALPPSWKAVPIQAGLVEVWPSVLVGSQGWEQSLPAPFRAAPPQATIWEAWSTITAQIGIWGMEQSLPPPWRAAPLQASLVDVWPAVFTSTYGWEQSLPAPYRAAFLPPAFAEVWPEAFVVEGTWGFEEALPPSWKSVPTQAGLVEVWPDVLSGAYGWEQALPSPFRAAPAQSSLVDVLPTVFISVAGWEQALPAPYRAAFLPPAPAEVWPEAIVVEGTWGFEQSLPPSWRPVPTQAGLVDVWPALVVGVYGWEQSLPAPFRAAFLPSGMFDTWPEAEITEGTWGFDEALPALWKPVPAQAGLVDVLPAVFMSVAGWEQTLPAPYRAAFLPPAPAEVWPEAIIVEGVWGFEQALPPSWKPVWTQASLVDVWPALVVGAYGWEQSLPAPFRAAFLPGGMFDTWPEGEITEGTWGFDESLPPLWRAAPLQAGAVDVWPAVFTSAYGWEQALPALFRAPFEPPAQAEAWPASEANEGVSGFEAILPLQFRPYYVSPQTSDPTPSTITFWGWELPAPSPVRPASIEYRLIEVFPSVVKPWPADFGEVSKVWQSSRRDVLFDTLASLIVESFYGWENLSPTPRQVIQRARNEEVFPSSTVVVYPWDTDVPEDLRAKFKFVQPTIIDVFPSQSVVPLSPWGFDLGSLQAKAGSKIILLDDWWPPIIQPNPLLPGGYKPSSIFEDRYTDFDFINKVEQTIEAIDGELAALTDEPGDDDSAGYKVAEPDVLPPGWRSGKDQPKPEREQVRHVHYNFASDLDFGVRRRIVGILDRAEHRRVNILGSDAFVTSETARVHGQLVVQGTNAWVLKVEGGARLELAKEALAEGFKLVSFDDTSLSFIHRPTYPWKQIYMGAGIGAAIMGAGVGLGYLIWGRTPPITIISPPKQLEAIKPVKKLAAPKAQAPKAKPSKPSKPGKKK